MNAPATDAGRAVPAVDSAWLLRLRTATAVGVAALVLLAHFGLGQRLPLGPLAAVLATWLASNAGAALWVQRRPLRGAAVAALLALDTVLLTAVLYLTGGPSNPFSFLYLVHVALGAVVLPQPQAWALMGLSIGLFGLLFLDHVPLPMDHAGHGAHEMAWHVRGMWIAFGIAGAFIVGFTSRIRRALDDARGRAARSERLAALATLAAGTAHELGTPLGTIAVVARELELELEDRPEIAADARLIRDEVERCRRILGQLRAESGQPGGEAPTLVTPEALVDLVLEPVDDRARVRVEIEGGGRDLRTCVVSVAQALRGLVRNALDASPTDVPVVLRCRGDHRGLVVEVHDRGPGMDAETLARAGEPFFTTKPAGRGMGLGVFLARAVAERLGGELELVSAPGRGTTATFRVPSVG